MTGKTDFECPADHREALVTSMGEVDRVLICGWRAAEDHMLRILDALSPGYLLGVVAGSPHDLEEIRVRLGNVGAKGLPALEEPDGMAALMSDLPGKLDPLLTIQPGDQQAVMAVKLNRAHNG
jgi:hypothetical protein